MRNDRDAFMVVAAPGIMPGIRERQHHAAVQERGYHSGIRLTADPTDGVRSQSTVQGSGSSMSSRLSVKFGKTDDAIDRRQPKTVLVAIRPLA